MLRPTGLWHRDFPAHSFCIWFPNVDYSQITSILLLFIVMELFLCRNPASFVDSGVVTMFYDFPSRSKLLLHIAHQFRMRSLDQFMYSYPEYTLFTRICPTYEDGGQEDGISRHHVLHSHAQPLNPLVYEIQLVHKYSESSDLLFKVCIRCWNHCLVSASWLVVVCEVSVLA